MKRFVTLSALCVAVQLFSRSAAFTVHPLSTTAAKTKREANPKAWGFGNAADRDILLPNRARSRPMLDSRASSTSAVSALQATAPSSSSSSTAASGSTSSSSLASSIDELKRVLEREYASFFSPMEREWYSDKVTFDDPMFSLNGVDQYQANVDMLASRNWMGKVLFGDAGIVLHSIAGGSVLDSGKIEDIVTRWTLRMTFKVLPWQPTARFSGISVYQVVQGGPKGVQVAKQTDYWDSINLQQQQPPGGSTYQRVDKSVALADFLGQLQPGSFAAPSAGPELPYSLLRRGNGYEVRRYPAYVAVETNYERRDEGFLTLGGITSGMNPLSPAIMTVASDKPKSMSWPVAYALPGSSSVPSAPSALTSRLDEYNGEVRVVNVPERVVAVRTFSDASVEAVVRRCDRELRELCARDGLETTAASGDNPLPLQFAQYDAVYTMGKRRGEVWIELRDGSHPWSQSR